MLVGKVSAEGFKADRGEDNAYGNGNPKANAYSSYWTQSDSVGSDYGYDNATGAGFDYGYDAGQGAVLGDEFGLGTGNGDAYS